MWLFFYAHHFSLYFSILLFVGIGTYLVVLIVTIGCICYYNSLADKSDTFIVATLYATFLFVVSIWLSYYENLISDKIYERKNYYLTLKRLEELFSSSTLMNIDSDEAALAAIISFQVLTGRSKELTKEKKKQAVLETIPFNIHTEQTNKSPIMYEINDEQSSNKKRYYINENGFIFKKKLQEIEDDYVASSAKIKEVLSSAINNYIEETGIQLKVLGFYEMNLLETNYEEWCDNNIKEDELYKKENLIHFIYATVESHRTIFDNLDLKRKKLIRYYEKCYRQVKSNIKRMKAVYGNRVEFIINTKDDIMIELQVINESLTKLKSVLESSEELNEIRETLNINSKNVDELFSVIKDTEENIVNALDTMQFALEDELNIGIGKHK